MVKTGISYSSLSSPDGTLPAPQEVARHAEQAGLDSLWASDHLATGAPFLESTVALAAAAGCTTRLEVGFGVLQLALRRLSWAAKQIGSLHALAPGRLHLGVGLGGVPADEWTAAGVPVAERARRTDAALRALPALLAGRTTELPDLPDASVTLAPAVPVPPVWIGGGSPAALRRAATLGDGWLPAAITPEGVAEGLATLAELSGAAGRPVPRVAVTVFAALDGHLGGLSKDALVGVLHGQFGFPRELADAVAVSGPPELIAERIAAYAAAGAEHVVVCPVGGAWELQIELLGKARGLIA
ncbi:LLM class flavin-dependent oxidoreductase [Streptomyces gossypiisoli]|uniref:LLM class flavin-dependent oxidoreductase n=1 Tax=Streptomyces gossypiisoli TaxID=2748864 RepID=UPI0015DB35BE|nr:LLM class flavin-dependent oxidoreductase [Streptomyces gossypiisoli]